jgi:uncharacterized protein YggE
MPKILVAFLMTALLIAGLSLTPVQAAETAKPPRISVDAEGKVMAVPDVATLTVEVQTQAAKAAAAAQENARRADALLKALKKVLGPQDQLRTLSYRLIPVYAAKSKHAPPEIKAYRALNRLEVKVRDVTRLAEVIDTAWKNGATRLNGPFWSHSRIEELQRQAAVNALGRARRLAEALAQAAGLKIKGVDQISTGIRFLPPRPVGERLMMAQAAPPTPIQAGEEEIRAHIQAVFLVGP